MMSQPYWTATVDFTAEYYAANMSFDDGEEFEEKLGALPYVDETCINHQCWVKIDPGTRNMAQAQWLVHNTRLQMMKLLNEYWKKGNTT